MNTLDYLNGCLDAEDVSGAAATILADPVSMVLERRSIERLYRLAFDGGVSTPCDKLMVEIIGDVMSARARQ